jgi:hypothetical protein
VNVLSGQRIAQFIGQGFAGETCTGIQEFPDSEGGANGRRMASQPVAEGQHPLDRARQELSLTGWVRPQDITTNNLLESWRIADAELVYTSSGDLGRPRGCIFSRIIWGIWP